MTKYKTGVSLHLVYVLIEITEESGPMWLYR